MSLRISIIPIAAIAVATVGLSAVAGWGATNMTYASLSSAAQQSTPLALTAGTNGATGPAGSKGATGVAGLTGPTGLSGSTGLAGSRGAVGAQGIAGLGGPTGLSGASGIQGLSGLTGAIGLAGAAGATGADGLDGAMGATGLTGPTGIAGTDGLNGVDGLPGMDGYIGSDGRNGNDGTNGIDGRNGTNGTDGTNGVAGVAGKDAVTQPDIILTPPDVSATVGVDRGDSASVLSKTGIPEGYYFLKLAGSLTLPQAITDSSSISCGASGGNGWLGSTVALYPGTGTTISLAGTSNSAPVHFAPTDTLTVLCVQMGYSEPGYGATSPQSVTAKGLTVTLIPIGRTTSSAAVTTGATGAQGPQGLPGATGAAGAGGLNVYSDSTKLGPLTSATSNDLLYYLSSDGTVTLAPRAPLPIDSIYFVDQNCAGTAIVEFVRGYEYQIIPSMDTLPIAPGTYSVTEAGGQPVKPASVRTIYGCAPRYYGFPISAGIYAPAVAPVITVR